MVFYSFWLAVAVATARAETAAAVITVLQELQSTDESRALLAGPAELPPSRAPSSSRAPLLLSRALPARSFGRRPAAGGRRRGHCGPGGRHRASSHGASSPASKGCPLLAGGMAPRFPRWRRH